MVIGLIAVLAALAGCAAQPQVRTYPAPSAVSLLQALRARQEKVQGLNLETRTTSWLGGERIRATVLMLVHRAGHLRFEAEVPLKGTVAALATDGTSFSLIEMDNHTFKKGPACPENVASLVQIRLDPWQIAAILLGDAPVSPDARAVGVSWDARRGAEILETTSDGPSGPVHLWTAMQRREQDRSYAIIGVEGLSSGPGARWRVAYEDLEREGDILFPERILFAEPGHSFEDGVEIKIRDRRVNPGSPVEAFTLEPPAGFEVIPVECP